MDNEIIKALECCSDNEYYCDEDCPFFVCCSQADMAKCSLDLINRQKEEIKRLNTENNKNFDKWNILEEKTKKRYAELYQEAKSVVRAEAVREFAERLKENINKIFDEDNIKYIDSLVKEIVGDNND